VARQAQLDQGAGERLPDLVRRLEEALYRQAASKVPPLLLVMLNFLAMH